MHIPDGFLDAKTAAAAGVLAAGGLALALKTVRQSLPPRRVPLLGMASAFVFAAQMINFPVAGGTSGHLVGAVLAAVLLGLAPAVVVMTSVLILQCFLFQDGGLTALGANLFNMAIVAPAAGFAVYSALVRAFGPGDRSRLVATALGAWVSMVAASLVCAGQLAMSGTVSWKAAFPAMAGIHALIGVGEAVITALVVAAVGRLRPELLGDDSTGATQVPRGSLALQGMLVSLGLVVFVAPFACGWPDGLESVAARLGFEHHAEVSSAWQAPWPDYVIAGWSPGAVTVSTVVVGAMGTVAAFALAWSLARMLNRPTLRGHREAGRRTPAAGS